MATHAISHVAGSHHAAHRLRPGELRTACGRSVEGPNWELLTSRREIRRGLYLAIPQGPLLCFNCARSS